MDSLLGIKDPWVAAAFVLCILSAALCVVYGLVTWNKGEESLEPDDVRWAAEEQKVEEEL